MITFFNKIWRLHSYLTKPKKWNVVLLFVLKHASEVIKVKSTIADTPLPWLLIYLGYLPWKFAVGLCRSYLPWEFAVAICRSYLPLEFTVANCRENLLRLFAVGFCICKQTFFGICKQILFIWKQIRLIIYFNTVHLFQILFLRYWEKFQQ